LHRAVVVKELETLRVVVAAAKALAIQLRDRVVVQVPDRAVAEVVALVVVDVVHVSFQGHIRFA